MKLSDSVDKYIESLDIKCQYILRQMRKVVIQQSPSAVESMSYGMPGYKLNGKPLIYFGAFKRHIGVYPTPAGITAFAKELLPYKNAKGSVQFPLTTPFPYELFESIVKCRVKQNKGGL